MDIGENLRTIRLEQGESQSKFAQKLGISRTYLSDLENNRKSPSIDTIEKIADKLSLSTMYLLYGKKTSSDFDRLSEEKVRDMADWLKGMDNDNFELVYQHSTILLENPDYYDRTSVESLANQYKLLDTLKQIDRDNSSLSFQTKSFLIVLMQNLRHEIEKNPSTSLNEFYKEVISKIKGSD